VNRQKQQLRLVVVGVVVVVAGGLALMSTVNRSASDGGDGRPAPTAYTDPIDPGFNAADQAYVDYAISQVEEAAQLAALAFDHDVPDELEQLAERIHVEKGYEDAYLYKMLSAWDLIEWQAGHAHPVVGSLQPGELERLDALTGDVFTQAWARRLSAHYEGALYLAQGVLQAGSNVQVRTLARDIVENAEADRAVLDDYIATE
jgi:uncharacterized protein (DUF305 family)